MSTARGMAAHSTSTSPAASIDRWNLACLLVAVGFFAAVSACGAQRQSQQSSMDASLPRVIQGDLRKIAGPRDMAWQLCVGGPHAGLMLNPGNLEQLARVHRDLGFRYIRVHGVLSDDMRVYAEVGGQPVYDFSRVDALYDEILAIGMKPFVELSFMPHDLAAGRQSIFHWKANVSPPKDSQRWGALITAFVTHLQLRYGVPEVKTWFFEVWNEPNYAGFWPNADFRAYMSLYAATADAIKTVNPDFQVGGPATAGAQLVLPFIQLASKDKTPVDFITTHAFAVTEKRVSNGPVDLWLSARPAPVAEEVQRARADVALSDQQLPLYITEWNSSYSSDDPIHDSYTAAAFILEQIKRSEGSAVAMSYWGYTDLFEEIAPPPAAYYGGFGLLTRDGIAKASYFAFRYLNELGPVELEDADAASWITTNADSIQALLWNETSLKQDAGDRTFYRRPHPALGAKPVTFRLSHLDPGSYALKVYRTGYGSNDAYTAWLAMGSPVNLNPDQLSKLNSVANDAPTLQRTVRVGEGGSYSIDIQLAQNDVVLLLLSKEKA